jgi:hypothetical protein
MENGTVNSERLQPARFGSSPRLMMLIALASLGLVTTVDALTPWEFGFSAFYVLPVLIATWSIGGSRGLGFAFLSAGLWYGVDLTSGHPYSHEFYRAWDAFNHLLAYGLVAFVTGKLRAVYLREQVLREDLDRTCRDVRELEGLLPVCAWCKKIRDDEGYWQELEAYLGPRTRASFSHGICPTCAEKFAQESGESQVASGSGAA